MNLQALQTVSYGLYVIGSKKGERLNGQVANAVFQVTSQPPTIAVAINKQNLTHEFIEKSKVFTVSVLCDETPLAFIGRFGFKSGKDTDKMTGINYKIGETGAPIIMDNAVAYLEVKVTKDLSVGSHTIFVGEVIAAEVISTKTCLTYDFYRQVKRGTTPKTAPTAQVYVEAKEAVAKAAKYRCKVCGYIYNPEMGDPDGGIKPGTPFEAIPDSWVCPLCGARKSEFEKIE